MEVCTTSCLLDDDAAHFPCRGIADPFLQFVRSPREPAQMIKGVPGSTAKDQSRAKTEKLGDAKNDGLHRHFTGSGSVLMFGGGVK